MQINVSQLLQEPIGSSRHYQVNEAAVSENGSTHQLKGECRLLRTQRSILVKCKLDTDAELTCSRCLTKFRQPLTVKFEEEYLPTVDVMTGTPLDVPDDISHFTIDKNHIIELNEAIRQYTLLVTPMKPLCQENCFGLCQQCGKNLNQGPCDCPRRETDPRWAKLTKLL
jgi:uncharacterized protein